MPGWGTVLKGVLQDLLLELLLLSLILLTISKTEQISEFYKCAKIE